MKATIDEMNKAYQRYNSILDSIPDYITNNLREMPANKGYIWKQVYLYGRCPAEKPYNKTVLFEKLPRQITRIHEWSNNYYRIFRKEGREVKTLESTEHRSKKKVKKHEPPSIDASFPALVAASSIHTQAGSVRLWKDFKPSQPMKEEVETATLHKHPSHKLIMLKR